VLWALGQPAAAAGLAGAFLLGLGLRALVPVPPLDGLGVVALLVLVMIPVGGTPPLRALLDIVGTPLLRLWT